MIQDSGIFSSQNIYNYNQSPPQSRFSQRKVNEKYGGFKKSQLVETHKSVSEPFRASQKGDSEKNLRNSKGQTLNSFQLAERIDGDRNKSAGLDAHSRRVVRSMGGSHQLPKKEYYDGNDKLNYKNYKYPKLNLFPENSEQAKKIIKNMELKKRRNNNIFTIENCYEIYKIQSSVNLKGNPREHKIFVKKQYPDQLINQETSLKDPAVNHIDEHLQYLDTNEFEKENEEFLNIFRNPEIAIKPFIALKKGSTSIKNRNPLDKQVRSDFPKEKASLGSEGQAYDNATEIKVKKNNKSISMSLAKSPGEFGYQISSPNGKYRNQIGIAGAKTLALINEFQKLVKMSFDYKINSQLHSKLKPYDDIAQEVYPLEHEFIKNKESLWISGNPVKPSKIVIKQKLVPLTKESDQKILEINGSDQKILEINGQNKGNPIHTGELSPISEKTLNKIEYNVKTEEIVPDGGENKQMLLTGESNIDGDHLKHGTSKGLNPKLDGKKKVAKMDITKTSKKLSPLIHVSQNEQGVSLAILKQSYDIFRLNHHLITNRIILALGLNPDNELEEIGFETYRKFMHYLVLKDYTNQEAIHFVEKFFRISVKEMVKKEEFFRLLRLLTSQLESYNQAKETVSQDINNYFMENYTLLGVVRSEEEFVDFNQFKNVYTLMKMNIKDIMDMISLKYIK